MRREISMLDTPKKNLVAYNGYRAEVSVWLEYWLLNSYHDAGLRAEVYPVVAVGFEHMAL